MSGTGKERKGTQNPFLNELVVENIAKYLQFRELKLCRRLSHLWKNALDKPFLKRCRQLIVFSGTEYPIQSNRSKDVIEISKYMEIHSQPNHPHPLAQLLRRYRNFQVENHDWRLLNERKRINSFYDFLHKVGPQMTMLTLEGNQVLRNMQDFVDILVCKYTPNLEHLLVVNLKLVDQPANLKRIHFEAKEKKSLHELCFRFQITNWDELKQTPWLDVFSRYSKLKGLCFNVFPPEVLKQILAALATIRKADARRLKLTQLEYTLIAYPGDRDAKPEWREICDLMSTANLSLERMFLDDSAGEITSALLQRYSSTLKKLGLRNKVPQPFPKMEALNVVTLDSISDLKFLANVPNLTSLLLSMTSPSAIRVPETLPNSFTSLTKFQSDCLMTWNVTEMKKIFSWMPNILILECWLDNKTFFWVCQNLPKLKELSIIGRDVDDVGVVGGFGRVPVKEGIRPNITNLKDLKTFRMIDAGVNMHWFSESAGITEKSVFQGFCLMPKLATLKITVKAQLSEDAIYALKRKMNDVQISVSKPMLSFADMYIG